MAKQIINIGIDANDGTGSTIRAGGDIINDNFNEVYTLLGNGTTLYNLTFPNVTDTLVTKNTDDILTNKTISGSNNTLSNIGNSSLTNSKIILTDNSSSTTHIELGETLRIDGDVGIFTSIFGDTINISLENTTVTPGSYGSSTSIPTFTVDQQGRLTAAGTANISLTIADDSSTTTNINLGTNTLKIAGGTGIDTTISGDTVSISTSSIPNASLQNSSITIADDASSTLSINLGQTLKIVGGTGINSTIAGNTIIIDADSSVVTETSSDVFSNKQINSNDNTITNIKAGDLIASGIFQTSATIDVTNDGTSAYLFNSHYSGNNPTLYLRAGHTYALNLDVSGHPFHLQTVSGAYSSGNPYSTGLTHVALDGTVTTGASALLKEEGTLYIEVPSGSSSAIYYACQNHSGMAGKIILGSITDTFTGDGSTVAFTINSGRNVNDLLVFVNGSLKIPTTDYTVSGTTLTFVSAPAVESIQVRYL